jgi:thiazole synthase
VLTAQLAREAFETDWVKLEVIGDEVHAAARRDRAARGRRELVAEGFTVLPYTNDDPVSRAGSRTPVAPR